MLIAKTTIDAINDLRLSEVIGKYIDLKKKGAGYGAKSPFTDEKTGSFMVSDAKNVWKDFSSGFGGNNAISFVMKLQTLDFVVAIQSIADKCGIVIEYDESEKAKAYMKRTEVIKELNDINQEALEYFILHRPEIPAEHKRMSDGTQEEFNIGYAPKSYNGLVTYLLKKGFSEKQIIDASLASKNDKDQVYDFFQERVMFPVYSANGRLMGFSGKDINKDSKVKYMNSRETEAFHKSELILGYDKARNHIARMGWGVKVEGNYDVTACHENGLPNACAPLGSAFTEDQALLFKKCATDIVLFVDNDKAGLEKVEKDTRMLLKMGFTVRIYIPETNGQDPYDCITTSKEKDFSKSLENYAKDAVEYLAEKYFENATGTVQKAKAEEELSQLLSLVANNKLRNSYTKEFSKTYGVDKRTIEKDVAVAISARAVMEEEEDSHGGYRLPSWLTAEEKDEWNELHFYADKRPGSREFGYHFATQHFSISRMSNFVVTPLFQIKAMNESKRIMEIDNGKKKQLVEMPNKGFSTMNIFGEVVLNFGDFWWDGNPTHFQRLRRKLLTKFAWCEQIQTLGWHRAGFFAFANGIVDRTFKPIDRNGICNFNDENYYLPAFSKIYEAIGEDNEEFESDKQFVYKPSKIRFDEWAKQFNIVFKSNNNGPIGVMYLIAGIFRDLIFKELTFFPHLFSFGTVQTGKSTFSRSLYSVFYGHESPMNLTSSTPVAISRKIARVRNSLVWLDEYDNNLHPDIFNLLKRSFDGISRETGNIRGKKSTDITKVESAMLISGQYMPTRDDQSLFTRSFLLEFIVKSIDFTVEDNKQFKKLRAMEEEGLSQLITECMQYRSLMEKEFERTRFEIESDLKDRLNGEEVDGRVMKNFTILLACHKVLGEPLNIPFTYTEIEPVMIDMLKKQSEQINDSNILARFWQMLQFLVEINLLRENEDFMIVQETQIKVRQSAKESEWITLEKPTRVMYLRFTKTHPIYLEHMRKINEDGIPEQTIKNYMKAQKYFLGNCPAVSFPERQTSAYAFDYEELGIELSRIQKAPQAAQSSAETKDNNEYLPF